MASGRYAAAALCRWTGHRDRPSRPTWVFTVERVEMQRDLQKADREALHQALKIAGGQTLPVTARSLTAAEVAAIDRGMMPIGLGVYLVIVFAILVMLVLDPTPGNLETLAIVVPFASLMGLGLWLFLRSRGRRRRDYRDPQIVVEVQEGGLTFRAPGRVAELPYDGADFSFNAPTAQNSTFFLGIVLESPFIPLRLDDLWFKPGRAVAAAIVKKCDDGGMFPGAVRPSFWS
jgi:hypothetical protein